MKPDLRKMIVFAQHNLLKDAPFTRLDLATCRNFLIYLQPTAQAKVLSILYYGLRVGGTMMLGLSESLGELTSEFATIDERQKMFRKLRDVRLPADMRFMEMTSQRAPSRGPALSLNSGAELPVGDVLATYDSLLEQYMPPGFLISSQRELIHTFGGAGKYLAMSDGRISRSLLDLIRGDLRLAITGGLQRIAKGEPKVVFERLRIVNNGENEFVRLMLRSIASSDADNKCLITIEELQSATPESVEPGQLEITDVTRVQIANLESELQYAKENLQATIEELETSNEELQATNEELMASNEELQSTNEELHSVNEELYTVNAEHQKKIGELTELTNDMENLLHSTDVAIVFLDHDLCIRKFTPSVARIFDLVERDIGRKISSFTHCIQFDDLTAHLQSVLEKNTRLETEVQDQNGHSFFMRLLPYRIAEKTQGVVFSLIDISTLVEARKRIQHLSSIVSSSEDAIISIDLAGTIVSWNNAATTIYGFSASEAVGNNISMIIPAQNPNELPVLIDRVRNGEKVSSIERVRMSKSGESLHVSLSLSPIRNEVGQVIGISGISQDITELKRDLRIRERLQSRYALAVKATGVAVWQWEPHDSTFAVSDQFDDVVGMKIGDMESFLRFLHREDRDRIENKIRSQSHHHSNFDVEFRLKIKNGRYRWFRMCGEAEFETIDAEQNEERVCVAGTLEDVHDRKLSRARLKAEIERRDAFLAMLSHELRNPVSTVLNAVRVHQATVNGRSDEAESVTGEPNDHEPFEVIGRQADHMARLLDDLLDVARVRQNKIEYRKQILDLVEQHTAVLDGVRHQIKSKRQTLHVSVPKSPIFIRGDETRIQQLQLNLLTNASKYAPSGGQIWYDLSLQDDQAIISVRDNGEGITTELLPKIFEIFVQSDTSLARISGGLGVGLALAKSIAEAHGGKIRAESAGKDHGSQFFVELPISKLSDLDGAGPMEEEFDEVDPMLQSQEPNLVVLVEDNADARQMMRQILEIEGYQVVVAEDGSEGLHQILKHRPKVALVDVGLPILDGYEIAKRLRARTPSIDIQLIALTGYGQAGDRERAIAAGFDDHLTKPVELKKLHAILQAAIAN